MTHRGDTRFAHIHTPALPSCSQIACCIDVDKVDVDKALCVRVHVHCMRAPCPLVYIVRACPAPSCTCPAHTCAQALFARGCHASFVCIDLSPRLLAYGLLGGCTQVPLHIWVHAYLYCAIYNKRWACIHFGDICIPAWNCVGGYVLTIPPAPYPNLLPSATTSSVSSFTATTIGGGLPPSIMGSRRRHVHCCTAWPTRVDFVLTVTLSMHRRDLTPILPPTQHTCMQPPSATHSHPPHGMSANLIKLCSRNIPLRVLWTPVRVFAFSECEFPTLALYQ